MLFVAQVRGSPWVIARRRAGHASDGQSADGNGNQEFLMMTSATLIEALYEAVDEWLRDHANGKSLAALDEKEPLIFNKVSVGVQISVAVVYGTI